MISTGEEDDPQNRPRSPNEKQVNDREQCFENRQGNTCSNRFDGASTNSELAAEVKEKR